MSKISIFPTEAIKIKKNDGTYEYFSKACDADGTYDIGNKTNVELKASFSDSAYCPSQTVCTYDMFNDHLSPAQFNSMFIEYTVTYTDDNGCKSSNQFKMCDKVFTRPIDEVTSDHPKGISAKWEDDARTRPWYTNYDQWWGDGTSARTQYWDEDSAFVTTSNYGACQNVCNGFELSTNVFTKFYSATTEVSEAGDHGSNIPWDDIQWVEVTGGVSTWWCKPIIIADNCDGFNVTTAGSESHSISYCTDIRGTGIYSEDHNIHEDNCYGFLYPWRTPLWCMANRRSKIRYGADAYNGPANMRLGKFVIELADSMDVFSSLGGIAAENGEASLRACRCIIDSHNSTTFTAHDPALPTTDPNYSFTGNVVHFMSPVEVYVFQKKEGTIVTTFTYTVKSDVNGATVTWSGGASGTATISGGKATTTNTTGQPVIATLSYGSTQFTNNGATITPNGSQTINSVSTTYLFTVYSDVNGAAVLWSNGATGTISGGYHQISSSSNTTLTCTLTKSGVQFNNGGTGTCVANGTVTINRYVPSTVYAFTVFSDVEGADVTWRNASTSAVVGTGTISSGQHVLTLASNNTLTCTLSKSGVRFDSSNGGSCAAGGGIRINRYVEECTFSVNITSGSFPGEATYRKHVGSYSVGGSCAGATPTVSFVNDGGYDFITEWLFMNGEIYASCNTNQGGNKGGRYSMVVSNKGQIVEVTQIRYNPCASTPAPDFSITSFNHPYNSSTGSYQSEFTSACWKINSITPILDPPGYSFATASHAVVGNRNMVNIYCNRGQRGYSITVQANLGATDGSGRLATKTIKVTWV